MSKWCLSFLFVYMCQQVPLFIHLVICYGSTPCVCDPEVVLIENQSIFNNVCNYVQSFHWLFIHSHEKKEQ